jgi:hydroxymethylpyrimidine pyrophosphatase-like HAD family hydrolase
VSIRDGKEPLYLALATDGDGTLTDRGRMPRGVAAALRGLRAAGRKVVLVTGECREQLEHFPHTELFDLIVAENGAALYWPASGRFRPLAAPPPAGLLRRLERRGIELSLGRVIVSTDRPNCWAMREAIREADVGWRLVPNRDRMMALPEGVDKASGLAAAAAELGLSPGDFVGVGDAENDVPLLRFSGRGAAVATAVPALKRVADVVTQGGPGHGVAELIGRMLAGDLPRPRRGRPVSARLIP